MSEEKLPKSGWSPAFDFVFFRREKAEQRTLQSGLVLPHESNMFNARVIAVGPGRTMPSGALREPPCKRGDYIRINAVAGQLGPITEFVDDDGEITFIVGGEYIVSVRSDAPPMQLVKPAEPEIPTAVKGNGKVILTGEN